MIGPIVNPVWQEWAAVALAEGRLSWRVTDAQGRPCNGGCADPLPLGEWSSAIEDPELCRRGWHTTSDPLRWRGSRVWLVEGEGPAGTEEDKSAWRRIRPLAEVDPHRSICQRISVAAMRPHLAKAYLTGAHLHEADLRGAYLAWAYLRGAYLREADLTEADLRGADLRGANLRGANLRGANLHEAHLRGADLAGAVLGGWERGPDGIAREVTP